MKDNRLLRGEMPKDVIQLKHLSHSLERSFILLLVLVPIMMVKSDSAMASLQDASGSSNDATGGHLGTPPSPAIDLRNAADAHVTPIGSYKTSIPIEVPPSPAAPDLTLNYDSTTGLGIAGIGWDLSVGWPSLINRDTRWGTPTWDYTNPWMWGGAPLVQDKCSQPGNCDYRTAPDSLAVISINQITGTASATVALPSGVQLQYEAIHYDGKTYPAAPAGAMTDVFAFLLKSVRNPNGYLICFINKDWGDTKNGRAAVLEEILYGVGLTDCRRPANPTVFHRIKFVATDPTQMNANKRFYYSPVSYRFGAPVSFNNLLTEIRIYPAGWSDKEPLYASYVLHYEAPTDTETRQPRLESITRRALDAKGDEQERVIRQFKYGNRNADFDPTPQVLDLGPDGKMPSSLSGSVTRPVRVPEIIGNPGGVFALGQDQEEPDAPAAAVLARQWTMVDLNGDGLLDTLITDEKGNRYFPSPSNQWVYINEGTAGDKQFSSTVVIDTAAPSQDPSVKSIAASYPPTVTNILDPTRGETNWIWQEGLSNNFERKARIVMPESVTSPGVYQGGTCPAIDPSSDTRIWPYLPDGIRLNSGRSFDEILAEKLTLGSADVDALRETLKRFESGFVPRSTITAQLSGWTDLNHDGVPDWVVTPAMIEKFDLPLKCLTLPPSNVHEATDYIFPHPKAGANHPRFITDTSWYVAPGNPAAYAAPNEATGPNSGAQCGDLNGPDYTCGQVQYSARPVSGPAGPMAQPLSFSIDWSQSSFFGFTLPIGSAISSIPALSQSWTSPAFWIALANLTVQTIEPRSKTGMSVSLNLNTGSLTQSLANSAISDHAKNGQWTFTNAASSAVLSSLDFNMDITIFGAGNFGRSQNRAELIDWNADGCPDYLLYDSAGLDAGTPATQRPGGLVLYLSDCKGGFLKPVRINDGYDTHNEQLVQEVRHEADRVGRDALHLGKMVNVEFARELCEGAPPDPVSKATGCGLLLDMANDSLTHLDNVIARAKPFLDSSTDALPAERLLIEDARLAGTVLRGGMVLSIVDPVFSAARIAGSIVEARRLCDEIADTVALLAFRSRINVMSKGESRTSSQRIGTTGKSMMVQTAGLVDLNGDALPDYVITRGGNKTCGANEWEVYWGTGTSNLAIGSGFAADKECINVPQAPPDIRNVFPGDPMMGTVASYDTLPMQVEFTAHDGGGRPDEPSTLTTYSYVSLIDYNQDGRADLVLAKPDGGWDPITDSPNIWTIFLNSGHGFDLDNPMHVKGLSAPNGNLPRGVVGASDAQYPAVKTGWSNMSSYGCSNCSGSSVNVAFLDANADGTADIAQRVRYKAPSLIGTDNWDAAILYWSRAGTGPQDLMIEELEPLTGAQTLVSYLPAPNFQWQDGAADGNPPSGGHWTAVGTPGFMVRSVTVKPLAGLPTRATAIGFDYKDPYFDAAERVFRGFGRITITPLDPTSGKMLDAPSVVSYYSQESGGRGGETLERVMTGSGVPIVETLHGYTDILSAGPTAVTATQGITQTFFSARNNTLYVEYPTNLHAKAVLDLGFDGRWPFANRVDRSVLPLDTSPRIRFDGHAATGGAARFLSADSQRIIFTSPQRDLNLPQFTLETWVNPDSSTLRRVILQNPDGYELSLEQETTGKTLKVSFAVKIGANWTRLTGRAISEGEWSHLAASYDGATMRLFVNGVSAGTQAAPGPITYPTTSPGLRIGSGLDPSGNEIFYDGLIGELRIYPEAWKSPARISETRTVYQLNRPQDSDFGLPLQTWSLGDLADPDDDVYEVTSYAVPRSGSLVHTAVAARERRIASGPTASSSDGYLGYSETLYDGQPVGQVITGNITSQGVYGGTLGGTSNPKADIVFFTRYTNPDCPGVATETQDPLGAIMRTNYDATCVFPLTVTNDMGHVTTHEYYGVNGILYTDKLVGTDISGRYGQRKATTDPNGARTTNGYDEWGRPTVTIGPYDALDRPSIKKSYADPVFDASGILSTPARIETLTLDEMQHDYITSYAFSDGQSQAEAVNQGKPDWIISGTQDYDAAGRVIRTYKPRYLTAAVTPMGKACPPAGSWCNFEIGKIIAGVTELELDPLRDPVGVSPNFGVAHIQTAYDDRGRVVRVYGPDVPWCADPSAKDRSNNGTMLCDVAAQTAAPVGHFTSYEYPSPGVIRVIDARGVPTVSYFDVHGRLRRTEEDMRTSSQPYAFAHYTYDRNGNLSSLKDIAGNTITAAYDALGHKITSDDPDMGAWSYGYDQRGQLITQTDARGAITRNHYDALGRVTKTEYFRPSPQVLDKNYTFDGDPGDTELVSPMSTVAPRFRRVLPPRGIEGPVFTSGTVNWRVEDIPGTNNKALWGLVVQPTESCAWEFSSLCPSPEYDLQATASFELDLTQAITATLSFRYLLLGDCLPQIVVDRNGQLNHLPCGLDSRLNVQYAAPGSPKALLFSDSCCTSSSTGIQKRMEQMAGVVAKTATIPQAAMGKIIKVYFEFESKGTTGNVTVGDGLGLDDIQVRKRLSDLEDVIEHRYDSAELASSYASSAPVLDLPFDVPGVVTDRSGLSHKITVNGTAPAEGVSGRGLEFNGQDFLQVDPVSFPPFGHTLTAEVWVKPNDNSSLPVTSTQHLLSKSGTFDLSLDQDDKLSCTAVQNARGASKPASTTVDTGIRLPADSWAHVAMTYDGTSLACYVNGIRVGETTAKGSPTVDLNWDKTGPLIVGRSFRGLLDEVRVFASARQSIEVLADAISPLRHGPPRGNVLDLTFSDPNAPGDDSSGANNNTAELTATLVPGIEGTAASFDPNQVPRSEIEVPAAPSLDSNELTVEAWVKTKDVGDRLLIGRWSGLIDPGWRLALDKGSGRVRFEVNTQITATVSSTPFVTFETVNDGAWHHLAGTYDGESIRMYIDGKPAHRVCTDLETGKTTNCTPVPPKVCDWEGEVVQDRAFDPRRERWVIADRVLDRRVCVRGSIINRQPVRVGAYQGSGLSFKGMLDEIRLSTYAKRDFEVAASARLYSAYTQALGRELEVHNGVAHDTTSYDLLGHAVSTYRSTTLGVPNLVAHDGLYLTRTGFDNLGRARSLRYPDGEVVVSDYDRAGTQVSLVGYGDSVGPSSSAWKQAYLSGVDLTSTGRLAKLKYGNGVTTSIKYDEGPTKNTSRQPSISGTFGNELLDEQLTALPIGDVLQDQSYTYDEVGNLLGRRDYGPPALRTPPLQHSAPYSATYSYDDLSRLKSFETHLGTTVAMTGTYDYSPLGNLVSKEGASLQYGAEPSAPRCSTVAMARPPHAITRLTRGSKTTDYCYDEIGALAEVNDETSSRVYRHNVAGKLSDVTDAGARFIFTYDAEGTRVHKVELSSSAGATGRVTTEPFVFYRVTEAGTEKYYFAVGRMIARRTGPTSRSVFWYHPEHLGSTNYMTDADGNELQDAYAEFAPYGDALPTVANNTAGAQWQKNTPNSDRSGGFQFTGKELDDAGLYYYDARYYDPAIGRFLEPDSINNASMPQSLNRYSYVLNNPLKYIDTSGHFPSCRSCSFELPELEFRVSSYEAAWVLAPPGVHPGLGALPLAIPPALPEYSGATISSWDPDWNPNRGIPGIKQLETSLSIPVAIAAASFVGGPAIAQSLMPSLGIVQGSIDLYQGKYAEARSTFAGAALEGVLAESELVSGLEGGRLAALGRGNMQHAMVKTAERPFEGMLHEGGWVLAAVERRVGGLKRVDELWLNHGTRQVLVVDIYTGAVESQAHLLKGWGYANEPLIQRYRQSGYWFDYQVALKPATGLH